MYIGPLTLVILALLAMLYFSYRQTIAAYPANGGSYTVAKENLGTWPGLLAAAALMIDYVLNVAVGISAGVAALVSAVPSLHRYTVLLCMGILAIIALLNLRGTGEAGLAFALPTYTFIASLGFVLVLGTYRSIVSGWHPAAVVAPPPIASAAGGVTLWLLLRAFASGCTAMTGVEAVSNGVSAFREPRVDDAHRTLTFIVVTLGLLLAGVAHLVRSYGIAAMPQDVAGYQSVLSQITGAVVGRGWFYYVTVGSILATLCLSANTSFVDFPRLRRLIARDDFLPRAFALVGRRLVYSVGIIFLTGAAGLLLLVFRGITDRLIPLFAVGAFLAFTLSQSGRVAHWRKIIRNATARDRRSHFKLWINLAGAVSTGAALAIVIAAKFIEGAWITVVAIPSILLLFRFVHRQYRKLDAQPATHAALNLDHNQRPVVLVPIAGWNRVVQKALRFSRWLSTDVVAVHLHNLSGEESEDEERHVHRQWAEDVEKPAAARGVPLPSLVIAQTPYRDFLRPLLGQIERIEGEYPHRMIAVVIPEVIETRWWQWMLHSRKPALLRRVLYKRCDRRVVVVSVPWYPDT